MKAIFPPCLIQTGRKLTFIWNFAAFGFQEGPAWNLCWQPASLCMPATSRPQVAGSSIAPGVAPKHIGSQRIARGSHEDRTKLGPSKADAFTPSPPPAHPLSAPCSPFSSAPSPPATTTIPCHALPPHPPALPPPSPRAPSPAETEDPARIE